MTLFVNTDVDLPFDIVKGFAIEDVKDVTILLRKGDFGLEKSLGAGITILDGAIIFSIARDEIATSGAYDIYARVTDQGDKQRGIILSPNKITFQKFPV
ncbi:hypothetical protein [Marinobacter sp. BGYM27]|uniref:hypothetical protein n=1 Tax=Marinobacter sp. BGYM27 TaxID=2975597 RepID=UPI0021A8F619|nr:hypothetical protein [Marinobacter sp. BGYM27]MDG5498957.1 hypothetical protein [Marinobacter sp. BGYM27]